MAKYPVPGGVKTRLARVVGAAAAAELSAAFVGDLAERLQELGCSVAWAFWPPDAPFERLVPGAPCVAQQGEDLGARLTAAVAWAFDRSQRPLAILGADVPHVPAAGLREAEAALAGGAEVVLGPAHDGGYYLVALRAPQPGLFAGVAWGGADVLAATLARARAAGLRVHLLPPTFDVDAPADLTALRRLLADGVVTLPRTAAVLARFERAGVA
ncbi:MAG TPA: TIGR04282 family arsenosugar biosynthesis glycosyltransferase [Candidatus Binatia bacterium]|nr:TIGR04282 family arsenosugar biosynthesis glycosyltransferase [Candidatus Binatia bacterium]